MRNSNSGYLQHNQTEKTIHSPNNFQTATTNKKFLIDNKGINPDPRKSIKNLLGSSSGHKKSESLSNMNESLQAKTFTVQSPPARSTATGNAHSRKASGLDGSRPITPNNGFFSPSPTLTSINSGLTSPNNYMRSDSVMKGEEEENSEFFVSQMFNSLSMRALHMRTRSTGFFDTSPDILDVNQRALEVCSPKASSYKDKVSLLNNIEAKKIKYGNTNRSEIIKNNTSLLEYLRTTKNVDREKLKQIQVDDKDFIKKVESIMMDVSKKHGSDSAQDGQFELSIGGWNHIPIERLQFVYCFFFVKGRLSPAKIQIKSSEISRVKTYVSSTLEKPTSMNCEYQYDGKVFKIFEKNKNSQVFQNTCFYFALTANASGTLSIKIEFPEHQETVKQFRKSVSSLVAPRTKKTLDDDYYKSADFLNEIKQIKKEKKLKLLRLSSGRNMVEENKKVEQYLPQYQAEKRKQIKMRSEELMRETLYRKTIQDRKTLEIKALKALKYDFQKAAQEYLKDTEKKRRRAEYFCKTWASCIFLSNLCESIKYYYYKRKEMNEKKTRMLKAFCLLAEKGKQKLRKKGDSEEERLIFDIRIALQTHCLIAKKIKEPRAQRIMVKFFEEGKRVHFLNNKFQKLFNDIRKVQRVWKRYLKKKEYFKGYLLEAWNKNYSRIFDEVFKTSNAFQASGPQNANTKKLTPEELRNEEAAQQRFTMKCYQFCLDTYRKSYDAYWAEYIKLNRDTQRQKSIMNKFKHETLLERRLKAKKKKTVNPTNEEKESNSETANNSKEEDSKELSEIPKVELIPPKLFVLPPQEVIDKIIKEVIIYQKVSRSLN